MSRLKLHMLGPLKIEIDRKPVELSTRKAAALLAYLAVTEREHSRDSLAAMFWPDHDQSRARAYVRNAIWVINRAGLEAWLESGQETLRLRSGYGLDTADFRRSLSECRRHGHSEDQVCPECQAPLSRAVDLYRDDFLAGFTLPDCPQFDEWQFFQADGLRQDFAGALERLVRLYDEQQSWGKAIPIARRWLALDPLHEPAHRWLMRLYALDGKQAQALKQYETLRQTLAQELDVEPEEESRSLFQEIRDRRLRLPDAPAGSSPRQPVFRHNLPAQLTSFIGRQRETEEIKALLQLNHARPGQGGQTVRLLTLAGPGGSGKTRLALVVAADLVEVYPDGVFFVDLATLGNPDLVAPTIMRALDLIEAPGQPSEDRLKQFLQDREILLVLDNFEHLLPAAPLVAGLLAAAPGLQVLVTSRAVLHLYGEHIYPVPPLELPAIDHGAPDSDLLRFESLLLFSERAKAARPDFALDEKSAALAAEVCTRLDGLPLAIELAAARLRLLSLEALWSQLSNRLSLLQDGPRDAHFRQRTLRGTIDWSYNLLSAEEQRLFARLSVFQGGRTLDAIQQVCCQDLDLDALGGTASLLDNSLIGQISSVEGEPRFVMLETIREYAREKLEQLGETQALRRRHAGFFLDMAEQAEPHLRGGANLMTWLQRLEAEHSNLRAALDWAFTGGDVELGMKMAAYLLLFWIRNDHHSEGLDWISRALGYSEGKDPLLRAGLLMARGIYAYFLQDIQGSYGFHLEAVELYKKTGDRRNLGWSLVFAGGTLGMIHPDQYAQALAMCEEGIAILREINDRVGLAQMLNYLGETARMCGDYPRAKTAYEEGLTLARELGDRLREHMMCVNLGYVAYHDQDFDQAAALFQEGLDLALEMESKSQIAYTLMAVAGVMGIYGEPRRGARLMSAGEALLKSTGTLLQPADQIEIDRYQSALREQLDPETFSDAWAEGQTFSLEQAVAEGQRSYASSPPDISRKSG